MRTSSTVASVALLLSLGGSTHAEDTKTYPASMCVKWSTGGVPVYSYSTLGNSSSTAVLRVDCPVLNDQGGLVDSGSWVKAKDRHATQAIECELWRIYANDEDGGLSGWSTGAVATAGSENLWRFMNFGAIGGLAFAGPHLYYSCSIPPAADGQVSFIANYGVRER